MSLKAKLTTLIITFLLLVSLLIVGVFAVKNTNFKVGGEIVFNAKGIEATITRVSTSGFTSDKTIGNEPGNILSDIVINNDKSADDIKNQFASWSGLNFKFEEGFTTATIVLTITNTVTGTNPDNYLDISASASATTINNAKISVTNRTGGTTALLQQNESETFTITFEVIDAAYSASLKGFVINFNLQKKTFEDFPTLSADMTYQTFKFRTIEGETGLSVEDIGLEEAMAGETPTTQSSGAVKIPAYVKHEGKTYAVTKIPFGGFGGCTNLTSITIPNTVKSIGEFAFGSCVNLTSITIPNSVTSIGEGAFGYCSGLTSIVVESGNSVYDSRNNCNAIIETATNTLIQGCNTTVIPDSVTSIGEYAFYDCTGLTSITIPNSVTSIGEYAFYDCTGLTSITIPNSVTSIGDSAFSYCSFTTITIPARVTSIGAEAFYHCSGLTSVTIGSGVTSIGNHAFNGCTGLTSITIPNSVTSIGSYVFQGCAGLTSVTIGNSVTSIGDRAFDSCTNLTSITIPASVTSIGDAAFLYCTGLKDITIPDSVTSIGDSAFKVCTNLTSITIPDSVTSIGNSAFFGCTGLTSITIPDSVTSIGNSAFFGCTGLTSITIPASVTSIGYEAFNGCNALTINFAGSQAQWNAIAGKIYIPRGSTVNFGA